MVITNNDKYNTIRLSIYTDYFTKRQYVSEVTKSVEVILKKLCVFLFFYIFFFKKRRAKS